MTAYSFADGELCCEEVRLSDLAATYGTPLYVYSRGAIAERCRAIESAFDGTPHRTCYAVKANANVEILKVIAGEGLGADVGSAGELVLALRGGFAPDAITFSGVGKREDEIALALDMGVHALNVESVQEIEAISEIASRKGKKGRILLRMNLDIDAGGHEYVSTARKQNKFGIPRRDALATIRMAAAMPCIQVRGVHSHIGSQITNPSVFLAAARALADLVGELRKEGITVEELDFGGGFGVPYHNFLVDPGLPAEKHPRQEQTAVDLVRMVRPVLEETGCMLSIQPGRAIVAESGTLLVRVLYRKETELKTFLIVDGGMNDLLRPSLYHAYHQIAPVHLRGDAHEKVDVVGPVCESGDFFAHDRELPRSGRGDLLAIMGAGAYGYVLSSNYNARLRPAEVLVHGKAHGIIRKREQLEDL